MDIVNGCSIIFFVKQFIIMVTKLEKIVKNFIFDHTLLKFFSIFKLMYAVIVLVTGFINI